MCAAYLRFPVGQHWGEATLRLSSRRLDDDELGGTAGHVGVMTRSWHLSKAASATRASQRGRSGRSLREQEWQWHLPRGPLGDPLRSDTTVVRLLGA